MSVTLLWQNEQEEHEIQSSHIATIEKLLFEAARMEGITEGEVSLSFVDDDTIHQLNLEYRGKDRPTDVLSFPMEDNKDWEDAILLDVEEHHDEHDVEAMPCMLGDIIISVPTALRQSEEYGHSFIRELGFLFVHGFLHLIGYDHDTKDAEQAMFARQEDILSAAGLMRK